MGITNSNKELSAARIDSGGSFQVRAEPDIVTKPTDIVLILDRWRQHEPCGHLWQSF